MGAKPVIVTFLLLFARGGHGQLPQPRCISAECWCACIWNQTLELESLTTPSPTVILKKLWHTTNGVYMWVYFSVSTSRSHVGQPHFQLGVLHNSRLRVECPPRTPSLPVDNMGL